MVSGADGGDGEVDSGWGWQWLEAVLEAIEQPVIVFDRGDRSIRLFNGAAERCLGYAADEVIGRDFALLTIPSERKAHEGYIERYVVSDEAEFTDGASDVEVRRKDGGIFPARLTLTDVVIGGEHRFVGTIVDPTKRSEDAERLEAVEASLRARDELLSHLNHDLRTPLNVILGFGQVLQMESLQPNQAEAVELIVEAGRQLLDMIDEGLRRVRSDMSTELPRGDGDGSTSAAEGLPTSGPKPSPAGGRVVLCVEDDPGNVELVRAVVGRIAGTAVLNAGTGQAGLDVARRTRPAVAIVDLNLPDMPGEEVVRAFKADPALHDTTVIVVSGDANRYRTGELREAGAHTFVAKPLDVKRLLGLLRELLESR